MITKEKALEYAKALRKYLFDRCIRFPGDNCLAKNKGCGNCAFTSVGLSKTIEVLIGETSND